MNYAWRDYGNRVGAWRLFELFDRLELKTTALLNAEVLERCRDWPRPAATGVTRLPRMAAPMQRRRAAWGTIRSVA